MVVPASPVKGTVTMVLLAVNKVWVTVVRNKPKKRRFFLLLLFAAASFDESISLIWRSSAIVNGSAVGSSLIM